MTLGQLRHVKAPFFVQQIGKRGKPLKAKIEVEGFSNCDPLDVGFPIVHFKGGGWLILSDFIKNYVLV
jgi:hypothetical protein